MRQLPKRIFITGTGTDVGKTIVAAILAEALHADYWKPVQCGNLEITDSKIVQLLVSNHVTKIYPEKYLLRMPSSPHYAAKMESVEISPAKINAPETEIRTLIEGAGGLMVPLSKDYLVIDLIKHLGASVILVSRNYLGSINHTILSIEALKQRGIDTLGVIYNGGKYLDNEEVINFFTHIPMLGEIDKAEEVNKEFVRQQAAKLKNSLLQHFEL